MYRGRWYTRYLLPDFIIHNIVFGLVVSVLLTAWANKAAAGKERRLGLGLSAVCAALFALWARLLYPVVLDPPRTPVPKHDGYLNGYFSGLGVKELRAKVREEMSRHDQFVVFACQFWCAGMYDLLLHSYDDPRLFVIPLELKQESRALTVLKMMEKFRSSLPGDTGFAVLYEPWRYPKTFEFGDIGMPNTVLLDLLREPPDDREIRFQLIRLDGGDRATILERLTPQRRQFPDGWLGPRAELKLSGPFPEGVELEFPASLPADTVVEALYNGRTLLSGRVSTLPRPAALKPEAGAEEGSVNVLTVRCSDWVIPQLVTGKRDNRPVCTKLNKKLVHAKVTSDTAKESDEDAMESIEP
jgi:hypothetical protein